MSTGYQDTDKNLGQRTKNTGMKNNKLKWRKEVGLGGCEQMLELEGHLLVIELLDTAKICVQNSGVK